MEPTGGTEPQNEAAPGPQPSSTGIEPNVAACLCYALGFITGILFLVVEKKSEFVRFHAVQSTVTFGSLLLLNVFGGFIPVVGTVLLFVLPLVALLLWLMLMWQAFQGERFKLPIAGDVAEEHSKLSGF